MKKNSIKILYTLLVLGIIVWLLYPIPMSGDRFNNRQVATNAIFDWFWKWWQPSSKAPVAILPTWSRINGSYQGQIENSTTKAFIDFRLEIGKEVSAASCDIFEKGPNMGWLASIYWPEIKIKSEAPLVIVGVDGNPKHWEFDTELFSKLGLPLNNWANSNFNIENIQNRQAMLTVSLAGLNFNGTVKQKLIGFYREIVLQIDKCSEAKFPFSFASTDIPGNNLQKDLGISEAFAEAGIAMSEMKHQRYVDIQFPEDATDDIIYQKLHTTMLENIICYRDSPDWKLYLLIAPHVKSGWYGVMFDYVGYDIGNVPRQGAAVFWDKDILASSKPQWEKERHLLFIAVHELGHSLKLYHSFDKGQSQALSFMNYPWEYRDQGIADENKFWEQFQFSFTPEEITHFKHGFYKDVVMGGNDFLIGIPAAVNRPPDLLIKEKVELTITPSLQSFITGHPLFLKIVLSPQKTTSKIEYFHALAESDQLVTYYIKPPDSSTWQMYHPFMLTCRALKHEKKELKAPKEWQIELLYSHGRSMFAREGTYKIKVRFAGLYIDNQYVPIESNELSLSIYNSSQIANEMLNKIENSKATKNLPKFLHKIKNFAGLCHTMDEQKFNLKEWHNLSFARIVKQDPLPDIGKIKEITSQIKPLKTLCQSIQTVERLLKEAERNLDKKDVRTLIDNLKKTLEDTSEGEIKELWNKVNRITTETSSPGEALEKVRNLWK